VKKLPEDKKSGEVSGGNNWRLACRILSLHLSKKINSRDGTPLKINGSFADVIKLSVTNPDKLKELDKKKRTYYLHITKYTCMDAVFLKQKAFRKVASLIILIASSIIFFGIWLRIDHSTNSLITLLTGGILLMLGLCVRWATSFLPKQ
jgi:hypothetical protein